MPQFKYTKRAVVQVALENPAGTDPVANYIAMLVNIGGSANKESTAIDRNPLDKEFGSLGAAITGSLWKVSIEQEFKPLGRNEGDILAPEWLLPMQACAALKNDAYVITLSSATAYTIGETVEVTGNAVGVVVDIEGSKVYVRKTGATVPAAADTLEGATSEATGTVSSVLTGLLLEPTSEASETKSLSVRYNQSDVRKLATYVRGNAVITGTAKELPKVAFDLQGIYTNPTDTAMPDVSTSGVKPQLFQNVSLTWGNLDTSNVTLTDCSLDLGNSVTAPDDAQQANGIAGIFIENAMPKLKFTISQPSLSVYNPFAEHEAQTERNFAVTWGTTDKYIRLGVRKAQLSAISETDKNGINHYSLDCTCNKGGLTPKWYLMLY